ncbi:hypothetical protein RJ639_036508 [Escallonia herrerae]|uniref:Uncharacterized protein n=1 Tax=Escallonia herrerae TaxID=1293975 RepID=A0AA89BDI1_9ASTE|nr:hypothetical protein RJ639_036508 [Escallonia herrerae]
MFIHAIVRKKFCVGFASRERSAQSSFRVGIASSAAPAVTSVRNALFAVFALKSAYLYMMYSFNPYPVPPWCDCTVLTEELSSSPMAIDLY